MKILQFLLSCPLLLCSRFSAFLIPLKHQKKKSPASVAFLGKRVAFFPLWPLWPLWCLCVTSLEKRRGEISSMKKKADFIEECTPRLFSREVTRGTREVREIGEEKTRCPFFRKVYK